MITECNTPSLIIQSQLYGLKCRKLRHFTPRYVGCEVVGQLGVPHICGCKVASVSQHHNCKLVKI